jgi:hypothetical protein
MLCERGERDGQQAEHGGGKALHSGIPPGFIFILIFTFNLVIGGILAQWSEKD